MISLKPQKNTQSVLGCVLQWSQHDLWMKRKLQAMRKNQQLKDKKNISLERTIMRNHEEQYCCITLNEISPAWWVHSRHCLWTSRNVIELCTTMKSTCSLNEEKTSRNKKESTTKGQE